MCLLWYVFWQFYVTIGEMAVNDRSGIWIEFRKQRLSIPFLSVVVGSFLLSTLLTDPNIDFTKPQSPGNWPCAMIIGLILVSVSMLFLGVHDAWRESRENKGVRGQSASGRNSQVIDSSLVSQKMADIIASDGSSYINHDNTKMVFGILGIFGYGIAVGYIGFTLATISIIAFWLLIWGVRSPLTIVMTSGIGTGVILLIFVKLGYLALPKGIGPFHEFTIWLFHTLHLF